MFQKKSLLISGVIIAILLAAILIYSNIDSKETAANAKNAKVKLVDVDKVVENPGNYTGIINVEGIVEDVMNNKKTFTLECEDGDADLPISYNGELPKASSSIIVSGEIKKNSDGKFYFDAKEIKYR